MAGGGVPRRRPRTGAAGFAASRQATDWAESGYELAFGQAVVPADAIATPDTKPADGTITVGRWNAGVRGAGREVLLSRTQGGMVSYTFAGNEFVLRRPAITTFRPLTDNDRGAGHGFERVQWLGAGRYARCVDNVLEQIDDSTLKGTYTYELATAQRTKVTVSYTAHTDGRVNLHVEYPGEQGDLPTIPAFGIEWTLPVQYTNLRFFGTGPEETYLDRKHAKLGVWSTNAFADHAPYLMPQETGNHEDVRWAEITDDHGHGMRVSRADGAAPFAVSLLPYSSFMLEELSTRTSCRSRSTCSCASLPHRWALAAMIPGCRRCTPSTISRRTSDQLDVDLELI